jgi:uncharacterized protein (TIGR01319 family)
LASPALLIDFGSTFTKVTAVDLEEARVLGRGQAPSTVGTDVSEGLFCALEELNKGHNVLEQSPSDLRIFENRLVLACSSAAGGLRMVVVGLVPGLTVECAQAAALGAGAKIVGAFAFKLSDQDITRMELLRPDMILLTGGTDGGDSHTILHNAAMLARSSFAVSILVAGNCEATEQVRRIFTEAGKEVRYAGNVMPAANTMSTGAAQEEIRQLFMKRIVAAKGIDQIKTRVPVVLPTPMAVLQGALIGSQGTGELPGWGDLLLLDVGGATTDVHSIGEGQPGKQNLIPQGLPEPFAKRTVEGDLGIRFNAATILDRVGSKFLWDQFCTVFPEFSVTAAVLTAYIREITEKTDQVPQADWHYAVDAVLARIAVDIAIERHVGKLESYYSQDGEVWLQHGKDLSGIHTMIGTGGVFRYNPFVDRILSKGLSIDRRFEVLRPTEPHFFVDRDYILYAVGLLAENYPEVALRIFQDHIRPLECRFLDDATTIKTLDALSKAHAHDHDCC